MTLFNGKLHYFILFCRGIGVKLFLPREVRPCSPCLKFSEDAPTPYCAVLGGGGRGLV